MHTIYSTLHDKDCYGKKKQEKKPEMSRYLNKGDLRDVETYSGFSSASRPKAEAAQRRTITRYFILYV
jgi:hypothetical protein